MATWYWGGQNGWEEYDSDSQKKLERAFKSNKSNKVQIDELRFVDMSDRNLMQQRRYDDHNRVRGVKRVEKKKPEKESKKEKEEEEEEEEEEKVEWFYEGDPKTKKGKAPWVAYDDVITTKLETAYRRKRAKAKIDKERFVDFSDRNNIVQRRYDDHDKMRAVKREVTSSSPKVSKAKKAKVSAPVVAATTTTSGRRQKNDSNLKQLTSYEQQEYAMALDPRLSAFYSESAGLHDEIVEDNAVKRDSHSNPAGAEYDLGRDGAFGDFTVLIGQFLTLDASLPINALRKKGFNVVVEKGENQFLKQLPKADVAWIFSGLDQEWQRNNHAKVQPYKGCSKARFQEEVKKFHEDGGGLMLWADNSPYFEHANTILPFLLNEPEVVLTGDTPGNKVMKVGLGTNTQEFSRHTITSGLTTLYEGTTICYPKTLGKLKVLGTSSDGFPAICYADHEVLDANCGRLIVDTGFTKNYCSWDEAGTARYIINATVWLLGLEHKLIQGEEITARAKRSKSSK